MRITELTRRNIIDHLIKKGDISGRLELVIFLERTWKLSNMDSKHNRFRTLKEEIQTKIVDFKDKSEYHLFFEMLKIFELEDRRFLDFLEQIVHPAVRTSDTQAEYAGLINLYLVKESC
jgi:AbiJ N-terminal domain 3